MDSACQLDRLTVRQFGTFTAAQAGAAGLTRDQVRERLRDGRWVRWQRGTCGAPGAQAGLALEHADLVAIRAATLAVPGAVASGTTAGRLWRLPVLGPRDPLPHLTVPRRGIRTRSAVRVRYATLPDEHVDELWAVPVTSMARTVVDFPAPGRSAKHSRSPTPRCVEACRAASSRRCCSPADDGHGSETPGPS